jgi:hypothetical protein
VLWIAKIRNKNSGGQISVTGLFIPLVMLRVVCHEVILFVAFVPETSAMRQKLFFGESRYFLLAGNMKQFYEFSIE